MEEKMKTFKKFIAICLCLVMILSMGIFAGCGEDTSEEPTQAPTEKVTDAPTQAPTDEPDEEVATDEPENEEEEDEDDSGNLLDYVVEDDEWLIGGDIWTVSQEQWGGPLMEGRLGAGSLGLEVVSEAEIADGDFGPAIHYYSTSEKGYHISTNAFGIGDVCEVGKSYVLSVTLKYTLGELTKYDNMYVGASCGDAEYVKVEAKDEWQTIEYAFTAVENELGLEPHIVVGPTDTKDKSEGWGFFLGKISAGFDLMICDVTLVEAEA